MFRRARILVFAIGLVAQRPLGGADWLQWGFDSRHAGLNDQETTIHSGNVSSLHLLYRVTLPAVADGAPTFLGGVTTPQGVKDLLFLTTKSGILLAVDAATGGIVWSKQPATGPNYTTSSPAIDPGRLYVYSYGLDGRAHRYQVGDGTEITTGGWPQPATTKPSVEKGSAALGFATAKSGTTCGSPKSQRGASDGTEPASTRLSRRASEVGQRLSDLRRPVDPVTEKRAAGSRTESDSILESSG